MTVGVREVTGVVETTQPLRSDLHSNLGSSKELQLAHL